MYGACVLLVTDSPLLMFDDIISPDVSFIVAPSSCPVTTSSALVASMLKSLIAERAYTIHQHIDHIKENGYIKIDLLSSYNLL